MLHLVAIALMFCFGLVAQAEDNRVRIAIDPAHPFGSIRWANIEGNRYNYVSQFELEDGSPVTPEMFATLNVDVYLPVGAKPDSKAANDFLHKVQEVETAIRAKKTTMPQVTVVVKPEAVITQTTTTSSQQIVLGDPRVPQLEEQVKKLRSAVYFLGGFVFLLALSVGYFTHRKNMEVMKGQKLITEFQERLQGTEKDNKHLRDELWALYKKVGSMNENQPASMQVDVNLPLIPSDGHSYSPMPQNG